MSYIDTEKLKEKIKRRINELDRDKYISVDSKTTRIAELHFIDRCIDSLQQDEPEYQPEYGYLKTCYINGEKSRWNVGDTLAYYLCTSNEEGEIVIGKITNIELDDEDGWIYTFEDESTSDEQSLVEEGVYKKN